MLRKEEPWEVLVKGIYKLAPALGIHGRDRWKYAAQLMLDYYAAGENNPNTYYTDTPSWYYRDRRRKITVPEESIERELDSSLMSEVERTF